MASQTSSPECVLPGDYTKVEEEGSPVGTVNELAPLTGSVALGDLFADAHVTEPNLKQESGETATSVKSEQDLGGDIEVKVDYAGQPILSRAAKVKVKKHEPILWNHVPSAREEAGLAFQELEICTYQSKDYGESGQEEMMSCDCKPDIVDEENYACGEDSNCINRLTSIECTDDECNCGSRCANQRFQLREYAGVDVFHAGKKGYGLRALVDLDKDMFVYEYIGEVIGEKRFRQRQREYEEQGERHFYFMMLQKGEYIDATKKGGFGRFINHSCEPNCYVDKWVVGSKLRMGIFTKRQIVKGEELTFDYNVDRYGGDATPCYCGEPTCLGYIGGKTQTEAANKLPQNVVEALGIDDDDDWDDAKPKASRRRKKGQDDEEYVNDLTPRAIKETDVPKIMGTLLQTSERWLIKKLLQRIANDGNEVIQSKIVSLHGYQTLGSKLEKWKKDSEICALILDVLQKWPTLTRNKISSSKIETHVKALAEDEQMSEEVKSMSSKLLETWSSLEMAYRIPRRIRPAKIDATDHEKDNEASPKDIQSPGKHEPDVVPRPQEVSRARGPRNPTYRQDQPWRRQESVYRSRESLRPFNTNQPSQNRGFTLQTTTPRPNTPVKIDPINHDLQAIIDAATKKQQEQAALQRAQEEQKALEETARLKADALKRAQRAQRKADHQAKKEKKAVEKRLAQKDRAKSKSKSKGNMTDSGPGKANSSKNDAEDQRRLERIFAKFVPNVTAQYQTKLGKEQFKRRAKEVVKALVAKEMKREPRDFSELSESKKAKVKAYSRAFMQKVLARTTTTPAGIEDGVVVDEAEPMPDIDPAPVASIAPISPKTLIAMIAKDAQVHSSEDAKGKADPDVGDLDLEEDDADLSSIVSSDSSPPDSPSEVTTLADSLKRPAIDNSIENGETSTKHPKLA